MPTLQELQARKPRLTASRPRTAMECGDELIVTDQRSAMSPAQCIEEKLLRLLKDADYVGPSGPPRRPR
jgi:hypothetical protein